MQQYPNRQIEQAQLQVIEAVLTLGLTLVPFTITMCPPFSLAVAAPK
jgi:hypothetical protein